MAWEVEFTDEFAQWWDTLTADEQADATYYVRELEKRGPELPFPYSSGIKGSQYGSMRELRVQSGGKPIRIFYAFDSRRIAILLIGGRKGGNKRFYEQLVRAADRLFDRHLAALRTEHEKEPTYDRTPPVRGTSSEDPTGGDGSRGRKK
jgi:hypothetical protein